MNGLGALKRLLQTKAVYSLIMCARRRSLRDVVRQIGLSFWAVQSLLIEILEISAR